MIRVFLVDDHELLRFGVSSMLALESDIEVVGEASTVAQAWGRIVATRPDIVLIDVGLPDGSGIDLCREVRRRYADVQCIILSADGDDRMRRQAREAGACGYLLTDVRGAGLMDALRWAAAGRRLSERRTVPRTPAEIGPSRSSDSALETLTERQYQVLALVAEGLTNRQIGEHLSLSAKTVERHVGAVLHKLGLDRRTQAVALLFGPGRADSPGAAFTAEADRAGSASTSGSLR